MHVANNIGPRGAQTHSSFKRPTPVMGNRGLETRQSKRSQHSAAGRTDGSNTVAINQIHPVAQPIQVGALEVMNVKRVVNRSGTLPKVQRIGQFLDSLEDTNESNNGISPANNVVTPTPAAATNGLNGRIAKNANTPPLAAPLPQQMIRSNSSGGVTMQNNASASLNKLQRHRTTADGSSMMTFSSFRGNSNNSNNSPKRNQQPALANLEFPPPPLDLPPPPEEFENMPPPPPPQPECDLTTASTAHAYASHLGVKSKTSCNDVSNTAPSVEEASSRFGVSLRKREPSTDSCSSLGTPAANDNNNGGNLQTQELTMKEKLMAEIKDRQAKENSSTSANIQNGNASVDPVSLLVNELAESMNLPKQNASSNNTTTNTNTFKAQLKKVEPKKLPTPTQKPENQTNIIDFKSHLRKVEPKTNNTDTNAKDKETKKDLEKDTLSKSPNANANANTKIITTSNSLSSTTNSNTLNRKEIDKKFSTTQKTEIKIDLQQQQQHNANQSNANNMENNTETTTANATTTSSCGDSNVVECGKRRSTGSINSLKKLWEQPGQTCGTGPQSTDYASTQNMQGNANTNTTTTTTNNISSSSTQLSPKFAFKSNTTATAGGVTPTTATAGATSSSMPLQQSRYPQNSTQLSSRMTTNNNNNSNRTPPLQPPPPPPPQNQNQNHHINTTTITNTTHLTNSISTQFTELNSVNNTTTTTNTTSHNTNKANATGDDNTALSQQQQQESDLMTQSMFVENTNLTGGSGGSSNKLATSTINATKPAVPLKPTKFTIYATPMAQKIASAGGGNVAEITAGTTPENSTKISRESILELVSLLEGSLKHPVNTISASQWLQLSDKLNILQNSCVVFADNECMPPHSKFHFRELVTRVETQSQSLRTAGTKNVQDNERLVSEVGQSLKQITNALHR